MWEGINGNLGSFNYSELLIINGMLGLENVNEITKDAFVKDLDFKIMLAGEEFVELYEGIKSGVLKLTESEWREFCLLYPYKTPFPKEGDFEDECEDNDSLK